MTEDRGLLRQIADPASGPEIHRKIRDFVAVQEDTAGVRPGKSNEDRKRGRFSCTVGPQEPNDFTLSDLQLNVVNDLPSAIGLTDLDGLKLQHTSSFLDSVPRQRPRTIFGIHDDRIIR